MKKLSLILALIFVLTCSVLAACGDDTAETSSTAASTEESKAESSAPAEESSEAPAESSEEPAESSEEPVEPIATTNIAAGKEVTYVSGNPSATYVADLTDGVVADAVTYDANWFGLGNGNKEDATGDYAWVVIDLGEVCEIVGGRIHVGIAFADGAGVSAPYDVTFSFSDDGETFVGGEVFEMPSEDGATWTETSFDSVYARYVKVKGIPASWFFFDEVEVLTPAAE